jgi:hypothetical protein
VLVGARKKRDDDNLNKAIIQELKEHGLKQSTRTVLKRVVATAARDPAGIWAVVVPDGNRIIIEWFDNHNRARETSLRSFENRVSKLKKRLSKIPSQTSKIKSRT